MFFRHEWRRYEPALDVGNGWIFGFGVAGVGMFSDTIVRATNWCWMLAAAAFLVWEVGGWEFFPPRVAALRPRILGRRGSAVVPRVQGIASMRCRHLRSSIRLLDIRERIYGP
jgi:hypothetical protein